MKAGRYYVHRTAIGWEVWNGTRFCCAFESESDALHECDLLNHRWMVMAIDAHDGSPICWQCYRLLCTCPHQYEYDDNTYSEPLLAKQRAKLLNGKEEE